MIPGPNINTIQSRIAIPTTAHLDFSSRSVSHALLAPSISLQFAAIPVFPAIDASGASAGVSPFVLLNQPRIRKAEVAIVSDDDVV